MTLNCLLVVRPLPLADNRRCAGRSNWAWHRLTSLTLLTMLSCLPSARAQVSARIKGIVTDPSAPPVPAATVTTQNTEAGAARSAITDDEGRHQFVRLAVG